MRRSEAFLIDRRDRVPAARGSVRSIFQSHFVRLRTETACSSLVTFWLNSDSPRNPRLVRRPLLFVACTGGKEMAHFLTDMVAVASGPSKLVHGWARKLIKAGVPYHVVHSELGRRTELWVARDQADDARLL